MFQPQAPPPEPPAKVWILVLNYHHPKETLACVQSLLAREPETTRVLWIENDADATWEAGRALLDASGQPYALLDAQHPALPPAGVLGVLLCPENLGFAGGNNAGFRFLHQLSVPFTWVLNNDTLLLHGSSDILVEAALARPEVGAWGTPILTDHAPCYFGGIVSRKNYSICYAQNPATLESDPLSFVSGCSLFVRTAVAAQLGFLPEHYFLYYEDPAFGMELRRAGYILSGVWGVLIYHLESLSTGHRSNLMEFYSRRNRWHFIQTYFPEDLDRQRRGLWHPIQKYLFRGRPGRALLEWKAYQHFQAGRTGRVSGSTYT